MRFDGLGHQSKEFDKLTESLGRTASLMSLGIGDALKASLEQISLLSGGVDEALSRITPADAYLGHSGLAHHLPEPVFPDPGPNPIWETNRQLGELTETVTQLVEVARQQAELTQAIRKASDLALENSIQSGQEARSATDLVRKGLRLTFWTLIIAILSFFFSVYENHHDGTLAPREHHSQDGVGGGTPEQPSNFGN